MRLDLVMEDPQIDARTTIDVQALTNEYFMLVLAQPS
jgi:hypothetical protein